MIEPYTDEDIEYLRSVKYPIGEENPDIIVEKLLLTIKQKDDEYKVLKTLYNMERESNKKDKPMKLG